MDLSKFSNETGVWEFNMKDKSLEFRPFANADLKMKMEKIDQLKSFIERRSLCPSSKSATNSSTNDTDIVTLNLIKSVTERKTSKRKLPESFYAIYNSEEFDRFLLNLLQYFHYFFEREVLNRKQKKDFLLAPSTHSSIVHHKLAISLKFLGQSYCSIIMGLGLEAQHHMNCGKSRVSTTGNDQKTFETFYKFCANFVWISFLRKDRKIVDKEVGRLLRSEKFNPALRQISIDENDNKKFMKRAEKMDKDMKHSVPKHKKELMRPAIKRIIHQKSPVLESVFPSAKDLAPWLFQKSLNQPHRVTVTGVENENQENQETFDDSCLDSSGYRYGILGQQLSNFTDDLEENENKDLPTPQSQQSTAQEEGIDTTDDKSDERRQAISRATTELSSEDEEY